MSSLAKILAPLLFTVAAAAAPPVVEVYNAASMIPAAVNCFVMELARNTRVGVTGVDCSRLARP